MIELVSINNTSKWDSIVKSFKNYDVYYLSGYVLPFYNNGDGDPYLLYYYHENTRAIYVFIKRKINNTLYDCTTPYGYGGLLFEGDINEKSLSIFRAEYYELMNNNNIVSNFVRYNPILANYDIISPILPTYNIGETVAIDLSSCEIIWKNFTSKNRNMIRKAERNGVTIHYGKDSFLMSEFKKIYAETMIRDNAKSYYFFSDNFYNSIKEFLDENYLFFYAKYNSIIISISLIIFANKKMHYHLSGSLFEYRNLAPTNLLLYQTALWGNKHGFKIFHLGGGLGSCNDNLFKFKKAFNKNHNYSFYIGREIFDENLYDKLVNQQKKSDSDFDTQTTFFPKYRYKKNI